MSEDPYAPPGAILAEDLQKPELTPQDLGEPSPVPYSVFILRPSPDLNTAGREKVDIKLALADLDHVEPLVPAEIRPFFQGIRQAFRAGYYRFELVVGDWSIRVYKHPNNP